VGKVRSGAIRLLSPLWRCLHPLRPDTKKEALELENHLLRTEIGKLRALLDQSALFTKKYEGISFLAGQTVHLLPARVIYRDPQSWSSSFWVDVGSKTNEKLPFPIICKNSPVLIGRSLVGVIDYVGSKQSRVRLITDALLKPSVRAVRGAPQNAHFLDHLGAVSEILDLRYDLNLEESQREGLKALIQQLEVKFHDEKQAWYLAKGVLQGSSAPLWRRKKLLHGIGFNYDFADEEGPARELMTGKPISDTTLSALPILKIGDLLVTTGMDGVFPPGLRVAEVKKIFPLKEGAYTYEIEAAPVVENLDDLHTVFIIPSLEFNPKQEERLHESG
jgi:rod shape-determining protein MreC